MKVILKAILLTLLYTVINWAITCSFVYFIAKCFDIAVSLKAATGVWLSLCLLVYIFNGISVKVKNKE